VGGQPSAHLGHAVEEARDELLAELEQRRAALQEASIDVTAVES
jgi:hypothetical protein